MLALLIFVLPMRSWFRPFVFCFILVASGCGEADWHQLRLTNLQGDTLATSGYCSQQNVFIFLSPECPLCENYSVQIKTLMETFQDDSLQFTGVVSGTYFSNDDIRRYLLRYGLDLPILLDPDLTMAHSMGATITPEAFYTGRSGAILYRGAIDDWAISLGQKRLVAQHHYLRDAIVAHRAGRPITPEKTKAIGCIIE
jgi:peroxiredoxin